MAPVQPSAEERAAFRRAIEVGLRVGLVLLLAIWCFMIARPFIQPFVWGVIMAVAIWSPYQRLEHALGNRSKSAAGLLVVVTLLVLILPTISLTASLVDTAGELSKGLHSGSLRVPPPPAGVAEWPVIGETVHATWLEASQNLEAAILRFTPQLKAVGLWILGTGASTGIGIVKFALSILIAGALLANGPAAAGVIRGITERLVGERGPELTTLAAATVQSVTRGILGVALIQATLAGVGFLAVGVPAAGLWALLVLLLAVVQLPPTLILIPIILYVFSTSTTAVAVLFAIWSMAVGLADNILKPLLMGRGVDVPMLVIFIGAIGGFMLDGIVGLFVGAVVLALGYTLFTAWLELQEAAAQAEAEAD